MSDSPNVGRPSRIALVSTLIVATIAVTVIYLWVEVANFSLGPSRESRIVLEVAMLDSAFKTYKEKYGEYPPSDFSNLDDANSPQYIALANHLKRAFPGADVRTEVAAIKSLGVRTPAQAICFWLGSFAIDPKRPVSGLLGSPAVNRWAPLIDFDRAQLRFLASNDRVEVYVPRDGEGAPYTYFAAVSYATQAPFRADNWKESGTGIARPYLSDKAPSQFVNPNSFQIISAGLDGDYGGGVGSFPSGKSYERGDYDNITNFDMRNLGESIPK